MDSLVFQRVMGWDLQHINKLSGALKKSSAFSTIEWPRESMEFHQALFEQLSSPDRYNEYVDFVCSTKFDLRNSDQRHLRKNQVRYVIKMRWLDRSMEFIVSNAPEAEPAIAKRIRNEGNCDAVLERLESLPGGELYRDTYDWLKHIEATADDQVGLPELNDNNWTEYSASRLEELANSEELVADCANAHGGELGVRTAMVSAIDFLASKSIDELVGTPSYFKQLAELVVGWGVLSKGSIDNEVRGTLDFIQRCLTNKQYGPYTSWWLEEGLRSELSPSIKKEISGMLDAFCNGIKNVALAVQFERACHERLTGAVQAKSYDSMRTLAEAATAAKATVDGLLEKWKREYQTNQEGFEHGDLNESCQGKLLKLACELSELTTKVDSNHLADVYLATPPENLPEGIRYAPHDFFSVTDELDSDALTVNQESAGAQVETPSPSVCREELPAESGGTGTGILGPIVEIEPCVEVAADTSLPMAVETQSPFSTDKVETLAVVPVAPPVVSVSENGDVLVRVSDNSTLEGCFSACTEGRYDIAFWLSWLAARHQESGWNHDVFSAFVFGNRILPGGFIGGELISALSALKSEHFGNSTDNAIWLAGTLMAPILFCADKHSTLYSLRPYAETGLPRLDQLMERIFDFGINKALYLTMSDVKLAGQSEDYNKELEELAALAANELHKAQVAKMSFWPGECLLHAVYREGMPLNTLHDIVAVNDVRRFDEVRKIIDGIVPDQLADSYDLAPGLLSSRFPTMIGPARARFLRYVSTSMAIGRRWVELQAAATGAIDTFRRKEIEGLREYFRKNAIAVITEIAGHRGRGSASTDAALHGAASAVSRVSSVMAGEPLHEQRDIYTMLIRHPMVVLDDDFMPAEGAEDGLVEMLQEGRKPDTEAAFLAALDRREFPRAKFLLENYVLSERMRDLYDDHLQKTCTSLGQQIDDLEASVEDAYLLGEMTEFQGANGNDNRYNGVSAQHVMRAEILGKLASARSHLSSIRSAEEPRLLDVINKVRDVAEFTNRIKEASCQKMLDHSQKIILDFDGSAEALEDRLYFQQQFESSLAAGDQVAAAEIIHQAENAIRTHTRLALMPIGSCQSLRDFERAEPRITQALEAVGHKLDGIAKAIREGTEACGLSFAELEQPLRDSGAKAVEGLLRYRDSGNTEPTVIVLPNILLALGLDPTPDTTTMRVRGADYRVVDQGLRFTPVCPIPAFGTNLKKHLTVLVLLRRYSEDELRDLVAKLNLRRSAVLVFSLYPIGIAGRQRLRMLCAHDQSELLYLDLVGLLFVLSRSKRQQTLFDITLPFAYSQPYQMKGENVPEETFVGREKEVNSLLDKDGACIVFGGRQLGKSATLRHLVNKYHSPANGHYVLYRDIDPLGDGTEPYEKMRFTFWEHIAELVTQAGFCDLRTAAAGARGQYPSLEAIVTSTIKAEFTKHPNLRLTVLLDEADDLINLDAQEADFGLIKTIRGLMADTNRHFKAVFAGLQSVQQYQRWPNHPFAQLGREIVISPLPASAAQRLVVNPMRALGIEFESPELVLRILSTVNYHPGLIQIYCHRLLSRFYERLARQKKPEGLIRVISRDDLRDIERMRDFIDDIRHRFDWTLDLDDRYKCLTYALVLSGNPTLARSEDEFRRLGAYWWAPEFASMDLASIRSLLEEMEGLGVLVRTDSGGDRTYQLRSPNLLRLLGNRDAIEQEMTRLISQQSRRRAKPREFHSYSAGKTAHFSPFAMGQEAEILTAPDSFGFTLIFGSNALGADRIDEHLNKIVRAMDEGLEHWGRRDVSEQFLISPERFGIEASKLLKPRNRKHVFVVASSEVLTSDVGLTSLIQQTDTACKSTCSKNSKGRIILTGGAGMLWSWLVERRQRRQAKVGHISEVILQPWSDGAIWKALEDAGIRNKAKQTSSDILERSGGFQFLIEDLITECIKRDIPSADAALPILDELVAEAASTELKAMFGVTELPPALRCSLDSLFPLAIDEEKTTGLKTASRAAISVVISELDAVDRETIFGDLGRDAATDLLIQWMTLIGLVRGIPQNADRVSVPAVVAQTCFCGC